MLSPTKERWLLAAILSLALVLRLIAALGFPRDPDVPGGARGDDFDYHQLGIGLATQHELRVPGGGFDAERPPLFPILIGTLYALGGPNPVLVRIVQTALSVLTCWLIYYWTRRRLGAVQALVACGISAVLLAPVAAVKILLAECLASLLLTALVVVFDLARDVPPPRRWRRLAFVGLLSGLLTLTRANFLLLPCVLVLLLILERAPLRQTLRASAVILGVYLATLAPWVLRNQVLLGSPVLSTSSGTTLYMCHFRNPGQPFGMNTHDATTDSTSGLSPVERNRYLVAETLKRLAAHPWIAVGAFPEKLVYLFAPIDWELVGSRTWNLSYVALMLLALAGLAPLWRRHRWFMVDALMPLAFVAVMALPFYGSPRFRMPAESALAPIAAVGALELWRYARSRAAPA